MVIALIGIISIQGIWIHDAYEQKKAELKLHTNEALNQLVEEIQEDEAENYLDLKFGGVDSLVNEVILFDELDSEELVQDENIMIIREGDSLQNKVKIEVRTDKHAVVSERDSEVIVKHHVNGNEKTLHEIHEKLVVKMERIHDSLEKDLDWVEDVGGKMNKIESIVQHFTYEKLLAGELKDRLPKEELEAKLKEVLSEQGLGSSFDYAVRDEKKGEILNEYQSEGFDLDKAEYKKSLFPKDRSKAGNYVILLQLGNEDGLIWSHIHPMIWMSIVFTLLIILAFSFALYFIFKQKKVSRIKNDFINNMTHELKTPLASISLASASIKHPEVIQDPKQINAFVDVIESERNRMNSHIERVLEMAAMENNQFKLKLQREDFKTLINKSLKNIELSLLNVGGEVQFDTSSDQTPVLADAFHLVNAITNVLDNAIKYSDEKPKIEITLKDSGNYYDLEIKDEGIGMTKKSVKLAFDKFYREESGNIHNRKGFGLGLSYVKSIVEGHNGEVKLESVLNKGTTVVISLPKDAS